MENCNHNCTTCGEDCDERKEPRVDLLETPHELSKIKKVIGVVSGKGGVGKSFVTSMLTVLMNRRGYTGAIIDGDITGPSIPKAFGITTKAVVNDLGLFPVKSKTGISIMSINLLLENDTNPVVWRGPLIAGVVKQFWKDVVWGDVDYMFIDMPPGTGDVPLTVFQSIPVDGLIIVTSPQELVSMIVAKAVRMAEMMNIPILGLVENMGYVTCPDCKKEIRVFGASHAQETANQHGIKVFATLPIDPNIAAACDNGCIESLEGDWLDNIAEMIERDGGVKRKIAVASGKGMVAEHFGHCEQFNIYDVANNQILGAESIPNPGHKPGFLPNFLHDMGVNVIISGGMGGGAIDIFNEKGIKVITGARGRTDDAIVSYLQGILTSTASICHDHHYQDQCGS